jgi:hypothetical protein
MVRRFPLHILGSYRLIEIPICFPALKQGLILENEAENSTYLNEFDVRRPLVVSILQRVKIQGSATWFSIGQFQTPAQKLYLQNNLLASLPAEQSVFS